MFELIKIRKARRLAHATIAPFLQRAPGVAETPQAGDWLQPQIIGFLATLVTLLAQRHCGPMRSHALAAVQSKVLNAVTGIGPELIGAEICLLSSREDPAFATGALGAIAFVEALNPPSGIDEIEPAQMSGDATLLKLWEEHVDHCLRRSSILE
jgi:hypothetical protein